MVAAIIWVYQWKQKTTSFFINIISNEIAKPLEMDLMIPLKKKKIKWLEQQVFSFECKKALSLISITA